MIAVFYCVQSLIAMRRVICDQVNKMCFVVTKILCFNCCAFSTFFYTRVNAFLFNLESFSHYFSQIRIDILLNVPYVWLTWILFSLKSWLRRARFNNPKISSVFCFMVQLKIITEWKNDYKFSVVSKMEVSHYEYISETSSIEMLNK